MNGIAFHGMTGVKYGEVESANQRLVNTMVANFTFSIGGYFTRSEVLILRHAVFFTLYGGISLTWYDIRAGGGS